MESQSRSEELERLLEQWGRLLEALEQVEQPKHKPALSWLKWWYDKSETGVFSAAGVSLFSPSVWFSVCLFPVARPLHAKNIFTGLAIPSPHEREREHTIEEVESYYDSLWVLPGYLAWLLGMRLLWCVASVTFLFLERPVLTCTLFALPLSLGYLIYRQETWLAYGCAKMGALTASTFLWLGNFYNRIRIRFSKYTEWLENSVAIKTCSSCIQRVLLLILGQPTFDKLGKFKYPSLDLGKRQIRLLRIHRRIPFCDLKCELVCVPLDKAESYQAISYYWGNEVEKSQRIILNNQQFGVTSTVYNVLRRRSSIFASRLIWIDSICINQDEKTEKGDQVRMMNEIYKTASRVFVCLGNAPDARLGISLLHELVLLSGWASKSWLAKHILGFSHRIDDGDELLNTRLTSLLDLLHHPWFGRIWIIQEVVVARSLTVLYGSYEIIWDYLILLMEIFGDPEMSEILSEFQASNQNFVQRPLPRSPGYAMSLAHFQKGFSKGERPPLNQTLRMFSAFQSTCPRDKIFALLGFAKPSPGILQLVDYDKKLCDVLYDVAKYLYFEEGSLLTVLHLAGIGWDGVDPDCPSWVPNWTISREPTTLAHAMCDDHIQYQAATQVPSQISLWPDARLLKLRGQKIDHIKILSTIPKGDAPAHSTLPFEDLDEWFLWFKETQLLAEKHCTTPYPWPVGKQPTKQPIAEAFWRTLIGDRTRSSRPADSSYSQTFTKIISVMENFQNLIDKHDRDIPKAKKALKEPSYYKSNLETVEESMAFRRDIWNAGWLYGQPDFPRTFCVTECGMMGMVPKYTAIGDIICLIYGSQVPFVFRPTSEHYERDYELVGECYVHGMMDGEGLELGNLEEDFTIK